MTSYSTSLLLLLGLLLCLLIHEQIDSLLVVRDEINAAHEWLKDLGDAKTILSLVVLNYTAHGALSGTKSGIQHVNVHFFFASFLFA